MQIFSIYKSMEQSAKLMSTEDNIKLILRHSIRHDIVDGTDGDDTELLT